MNRHMKSLLALACASLLMSGAAAAQGTAAPAGQAPAARPRLIPPVRGVSSVTVIISPGCSGRG